MLVHLARSSRSFCKEEGEVPASAADVQAAASPLRCRPLDCHPLPHPVLPQAELLIQLHGTLPVRRLPICSVVDWCNEVQQRGTQLFQQKVRKGGGLTSPHRKRVQCLQTAAAVLL